MFDVCSGAFAYRRVVANCFVLTLNFFFLHRLHGTAEIDTQMLMAKKTKCGFPLVMGW